ncbi:MAG: alpha-galactosidase [Ruminiclostridium sp.]|nr:alpha-galactosidase [Ruminiclostridium sp.]
MMKLVNVKFAYRVNGKGYTVTTAESVKNSRISLDIKENTETFSAAVTTKSEIEIVKLSAEFECSFAERDRVFLNGYQSWTDSFEHRIDGRMRGIDHIPELVTDKYALSAYGDYTILKYSRKHGVMHGFSYGYVKHADGLYDFIGSLNENSGFTVIKVNTGKNTVTVEKDCSGLNIADSFDGLSLYIGNGTEKEVFDGYFAWLGIAPVREKPVSGYTSWYRHYEDINEKCILSDLEGLLGSGSGADIFQIDDGYQTATGDWLSVDMSKFPNGMKTVADRIKEAGLTAGLWLAPFVCVEKSDIYRDHPDWLLRDENGEPVRAGSNWGGSYALDIYNEEFRAYLREVFRTVVDEWGFSLLKLDFLYAACILPRRDKTRGMVMSDGMDLLRECVGMAKILGCGVPLASAFGKVEYCRIGTDVTPEWDGKAYMQVLHRERPSTKLSILNTVFRRQLNGRAFVNDPDVYMLRDTDTSMSKEQRRALAEINALCGGVLFTSDDMAEYGDEQHELYGDMAAMHKAELLAAEYDGNELILSVDLDGRNVIKTYRI